MVGISHHEVVSIAAKNPTELLKDPLVIFPAGQRKIGDAHNSCHLQIQSRVSPDGDDVLR